MNIFMFTGNMKTLGKDPFLEMHDCGNRNEISNLVKYLNELIDNNKMNSTTKKLK